MKKVRFEKGDSIFIEGDPSTHCYKIVSGKVDISLNVPGMLRRHETEKIATCGPGEIIGEMSVIDGSPRSASAVAAEPTVCMSFTSEEIINLLQNNPKEAMAYVRILIERIRHSNRMMFKSHGNRG